MRKASFPVFCIAAYNVEDFPIPDSVGDDPKVILDYLRAHLDEMPTKDLEWIGDEDPNPFGIVEIFDEAGKKQTEICPWE